MTDPIDDEALLSRFRDWLRDARAEADGPVFETPSLESPAAPEVGLYRLVEEFTALRHEVKLETKGSRGLQEQVDALIPAVRQAIDQVRSIAPREEQAASAVGRPLAEAVADLDEALARGRLEIEKARDRQALEASETAAALASGLEAAFQGLGWLRKRWVRPYHERALGLVADRAGGPRTGLFDALLEGYGLIQGRLRRAMDAGQVRRIDCVGRAVDPALMTVLEVVDSTDQPPGHVVDEVRRGYTWRGRVLRYAEVRAARERAVEAEDDIEDDAEGPELGAD